MMDRACSNETFARQPCGGCDQAAFAGAFPSNRMIQSSSTGAVFVRHLEPLKMP
jgi:hypothetical protein